MWLQTPRFWASRFGTRLGASRGRGPPVSGPPLSAGAASLPPALSGRVGSARKAPGRQVGRPQHSRPARWRRRPGGPEASENPGAWSRGSMGHSLREPPSNGFSPMGTSPRGTHTHRGTHLPRPRTRPCLPPHWIHTLPCTLTHSWPARLHLHIRETYTLARGSHPASSAHAPRRTPPPPHTHHGNTVTRCHVSLKRPVHLGHACHATPHTLIHPSTRSPTGSR